VWHMVSFISVNWLWHNTCVIPKDPITLHWNCTASDHTTHIIIIFRLINDPQYDYIHSSSSLIGWKKGISNSVVALLFHSFSHTWQQFFENFSTITGYQFLPQLW
jgi:hypothetical protein